MKHRLRKGPQTVEDFERAGARDFQCGLKYEDNPVGQDEPERRLAWSRGFNNAQATFNRRLDDA